MVGSRSPNSTRGGTEHADRLWLGRKREYCIDREEERGLEA